jgi:uncharacterized protein
MLTIMTRLVFVAALIMALSPAPVHAQVSQPLPLDVTFRIFAQGRAIGTETVRVEQTAEGWRILSTGQLGPPIALTIRQAEFFYDREWRPLRIVVDASAKTQPIKMTTRFAGGKATSEIVQGDKPVERVDTVSERTIVLVTGIHGGYEALAAQLASAQPGATLRLYVAPQAEIAMTLDAASTERVQSPGRTFEARRHAVTFQNPGGPLKADIWTDGPRLMRLAIPAVSLEVVREDVASVAVRQTSVYRPNDEDVRMPGNGFNLAGTVSKPAAAPPAVQGKPARLPAIVLVAGSGSADRDETVAGIPIFAQLASALADRGFLVLRYDKRGVGQSGGRSESATLNDYADDLRAAIRYLHDRKDVDRKRIAVAGHSEGAWVALLAARREKKIAALALLAGPGMKGAEFVLEQQRYLLDRAKAADKDAKIALQKKLLTAVASGQGWGGIDPPVRRQVDTPWFKSFIEFDPAAIVGKVRQPILVAQGELDRQVPPHHAGKLEVLAKSRQNRPVQVDMLPGLNHLFVKASTGEVDEYPVLTERSISPDLATRIADWLVQIAPKPT